MNNYSAKVRLMLLVTYDGRKRSESNGKSKIHYNSFDQASCNWRVKNRRAISTSNKWCPWNDTPALWRADQMSLCFMYIYKTARFIASRSLPNARSSRVTRRKIANNCGRERILSARFKEREREKKKLSIDEKSCEQRAIQWTVALHPMLLTYDRHTNQTNYPARACPAFSNPCPCKMIIRAACCYLRRFRV